MNKSSDHLLPLFEGESAKQILDTINHSHIKSYTDEERKNTELKIIKLSERRIKSMNQSIFCSECKLGRKVSMVGNGITQPPYLTLVQCPFEKIYYMDKFSECTHVMERENYLGENNILEET